MNQKLKELLEDNNVEYVTVSRSPGVCTAQEIAASSQISGKKVAKVVMVKVDSKMAMAVLPAPRRLNRQDLAKAAGSATVELASENEFGKLFSDCPPRDDVSLRKSLRNGCLRGKGPGRKCGDRI
jgi:Ala-tRNA(Pro) deacylase